MKKYDFAYYISFFHDGELVTIEKNSKVTFILKSASLLSEENIDKLKLNEYSQLCGHLTIEGIRDISVDTEQGKIDVLEMRAPYADILDFEISQKTVELNVRWPDLVMERKSDVLSLIDIRADKIVWHDDLNGIEVDVTYLQTVKD